MSKTIAILPGDGIGPEVMAQAVNVLEAVTERFDYTFELRYADIGAVAIDKTGTPLPEATLTHCLEADAVLLGAIGDPKYDLDPSARVRPEQGLLQLRKALGLYANVRPVYAYESLYALSPLREERIANVDFVVYRELTGGIYFGEKGRKADGTAYDHCEYSVAEIERIATMAFEAAMHRRKHLTLVDKANVLETSRLWRATVTELAKQYPEVSLELMFVDNAAMQLIQNPGQFDVVLTENMFGDILTDEASVITGSLGLLPSASLGNKALFEPIHGSYPQAAGKGIANPIATILSVAMMLEHFAMHDAAQAVHDAVVRTLEEGIVTPDLHRERNFGTSVVGNLVAEYVASQQGSFNEENVLAATSTII